MPTERRTDHTLRKLVILGNHLTMWVGRHPFSRDEEIEIANLLVAWDESLERVREERKEIEHISL